MIDRKKGGGPKQMKRRAEERQRRLTTPPTRDPGPIKDPAEKVARKLERAELATTEMVELECKATEAEELAATKTPGRSVTEQRRLAEVAATARQRATWARGRCDEERGRAGLPPVGEALTPAPWTMLDSLREEAAARKATEARRARGEEREAPTGEPTRRAKSGASKAGGRDGLDRAAIGRRLRETAARERGRHAER